MTACALTTDRALIDRFLGTLYGAKPDDHRLLLWELRRKFSHWSVSLGETVEHAVYSGGVGDLYIGCCTTTAIRTEQQRATADRVSGKPGEWADLDVKLGAFPDVQTAVDFLLDQPDPPSLIVGSGHGAQPWWLHDEYWVFVTDQERQAAQGQMIERIQRLREAAQRYGWGVDATQDLARILRIPGTWNFKDVKDGGEPLPVTLLYESDRRYPIDRATKRYSVPATNGQVHHPTIRVNPAAFIEEERLDTLLDDSTVDATWHRRRKRIGRENDQSPSGYLMSLAYHAVHAGWSDQEVCDLMVHWQRLQQIPPKHEAYYTATIKTAHESQPPASLIRLPARPEDADTPTPPEERARLIVELQAALALPDLARVIEWVQVHPQYTLELTDGRRITLGPISRVAKQNEVRWEICHETRAVVPEAKTRDWNKVVAAIMLAAERIESGDETTRQGQMRVWLAAYLAKVKPREKPDAVVADDHIPCFYKDGIAISAPGFCKWIKDYAVMDYGEFAMRIQELGGEKVSLNYRDEKNRRLKVRMQWLPANWNDVAGDEEE